MVLETIIGFRENPKHLMITGFLFSTIAILISQSLFTHAPSMVIVTFMMLPAVYMFTQLLRDMSMKELETTDIKDILKMNFSLAKNYFFLFIGMALGISIWFYFLPRSTLMSLFSEQIWNLKQLGRATALGIGTSSMADTSTLMTILSNNLRLVFLSVIMSFVFGTGSLFILSWNASVIGSAIGSIIFQLKQVGAASQFILFQGIGIGLSYFILHLIPEVLAYFYAAIAGALISTSMLRYNLFTPESNRLLKISVGLIMISVGFILLGAIIEVFVSFYIQSLIIV